MSENKFIAKLKGEPTPKSVVGIQNDRLVAPFKSSPMGHIPDRDSSVVVAKGAQNWAVNQGQLVPVSDDYIGTESDLTTTSRVSGAGLWLNATYTFPATGDETNPVSAIIAPSAKWVLTLCGDSLITQNGSVITLTMLVKIGATHLTTKQFKVRECASQFSKRLAIDFSESEQSVIKAHGGSPLTVQVLCDDEGASATIYSGMTHLTLLQRKVDGDVVAGDTKTFGDLVEDVYNIKKDYATKDYVEEKISTKANASSLTAEITRATNAESKLSGRITTNTDAITQLKSEVATKADATTVNNELATKATKSTDFMTAITSTNKGATKTEIDALDDKIDIAGTSGKIIGSYWFGKTKANTAVPAPTLIGQNYYDFATGQVYKSTDGTTWTLDSTNTPPTDIDAQIIISSKFWDITEQDNQHGGKAWWSHTNSDWSYSPTIYEDKPAGGASLPLLTRLISDHQFNDESYLNANTFSWQAGSMYEAVYQHLVEDVASVANTTMYGYHSSAIEPNDIYSTISRSEEPYDIPLYQKLSDGVFVPISLGGTLVLEYFREPSLDATGVIAETKDFAGINITYITATDGHRICLPDQESAISELYAKTGEANFYILDTENAQFKLPRTQKRKLIRAVKNDDGTWYNLYSNGWVEQGGVLPPQSINGGDKGAAISVTWNVPMQDLKYNASFMLLQGLYSGVQLNRSLTTGSFVQWNRAGGVGTVQNLWSICGYADSSVLENEPIEYEYYYVGNFTKEATENTAGLNAELFNNKVDLVAGVSQDAVDYVIATQRPTAENNYTWYRKYKSGWVEQGGHATTVAGSGLKVLLPVPMEPNQFFITNSSRQPIDNWAATPCVSKSADGTYIEIAIVPNSGTGQWVSGTIDWEVKGYAA